MQKMEPHMQKKEPHMQKMEPHMQKGEPHMQKARETLLQEPHFPEEEPRILKAPSGQSGLRSRPGLRGLPAAGEQAAFGKRSGELGEGVAGVAGAIGQAAAPLPVADRVHGIDAGAGPVHHYGRSRG